MKKQFNDAVKIHAFHIHIYTRFASSTALQPKELADAIKERFPEYVNSSHSVGSVGPHLFHNQAVHIKPEGFSKIIPWLQMNGDGLSILIHPVTGDEEKDHLDRAMWMGRPLDFNKEFFEQLRKQGPQP